MHKRPKCLQNVRYIIQVGGANRLKSRLQICDVDKKMELLVDCIRQCKWYCSNELVVHLITADVIGTVEVELVLLRLNPRVNSS